MTLQSLIERLEAGETGEEIDEEVLLATGHTKFVLGVNAYLWLWPPHGTERLAKSLERMSTSLDACRALHERLLPRFYWQVQINGVAYVTSADTDASFRGEADGNNAAAAWLIAILKAFAAKEGSQ